MKQLFIAITIASLALIACEKSETTPSPNNNNNNNNSGLTEGTFILNDTTYTVCNYCKEIGSRQGYYNVWVRNFVGIYSSDWLRLNFKEKPVTGTYPIEAVSDSVYFDDAVSAGKVQVYFMLDQANTGEMKHGAFSNASSTGSVEVTVNGNEATFKFTDILVKDKSTGKMIKASANI